MQFNKFKQNTYKIIHLDTPNKNNRIYPRAEMEKSIAARNSQNIPLFGPLNNSIFSNEINISEVAFICNNLRIEEDYVVGDMKILNTPKGIILNELMKNTEMAFRTVGYGDIKETLFNGDIVSNIVSNFELYSLCVVPADQAA
jgi:hypothetical protein